MFSKRIAAERLAMERAFGIVTSTMQERQEQYSHPLYRGAIDVESSDKFSVIPPGVNLQIFTTAEQEQDALVKEGLDAKIKGRNHPWILVSSRLDEKKNIIGVVKAYAESSELQQLAGLVICIRGIDDPYADIDKLSDTEQGVLKPILATIIDAGIRERVTFLNIQSQKELATTYRYFARLGSVFALTAYYEPFGLAPIEAAACGLVCIATENGGPSEIFEDGSGILVDPFSTTDIARGLQRGLENYHALAEQARQRVINKYTWEKTAEAYLAVIEQGVAVAHTSSKPIPELDASGRISEYLKQGK